MQKTITLDMLAGMERIPRMHLINTLSGVRALHLLGTIDRQDRNNLAPFNSVVHIGSNPASLGFILRPMTVARHTYQNIMDRKYFTLNAVSGDQVAAAHQASAKYDAGVSEFDACGFSAEYSDAHPAPYMAGSPVQIGLRFEESHHIKINGTWLIVGAVQEIRLADGAQAETGHIQHDALGIASVSGLDSYYDVALIDRYAYARPGQDLDSLHSSKSS